MEYKFKTGLWKALVKTVIVAVPLAVTALLTAVPKLSTMSIAAGLLYATNLLVNWLKNK